MPRARRRDGFRGCGQTISCTFLVLQREAVCAAIYDPKFAR